MSSAVTDPAPDIAADTAMKPVPVQKSSTLAPGGCRSTVERSGEQMRILLRAVHTGQSPHPPGRRHVTGPRL